MCHTSMALDFRDTHAIRPHPVGLAGVALLGLSIPVPELRRIFAPQGSLPKGSRHPSALGQGLWELGPPLLLITALKSNRQNGGETARGFVKTNKFKEKASYVFPQQPRRHAGCLGFHLLLLLLKGKRKGSRKRRGAGDSLLATLGTVMSSCQGDMAPAQGARPALVDRAAGRGGHPWYPLGWRRQHTRHGRVPKDAWLLPGHGSLAKP